MPQYPYFPKTDDGIRAMLVSFDDNIAGLAPKYSILSATMLRIHQARLCWGWFLDCVEEGKQWSESVTGKKEQMLKGPGGAAQAMPGGPILPAVPTIDLGTGLQPIKWEPDFFVFFQSVVNGIKVHIDYLKSDGDILGIEGAEMPPPDPLGVVPLKVTIGTGGLPQLEVPKVPFDGFDFEFTVNGGAVQQGTFVSTRRFLHQITLPAAGVSALYTYRARRRYKGQAFGQWSAWVPVAVKG